MKKQTTDTNKPIIEFVYARATDALKHPERLKGVKDVWDTEWDELLKNVSDDAENQHLQP
jgi:hypothetical protein